MLGNNSLTRTKLSKKVMRGLFHDFTTLNSNSLMDMSIPLCVTPDAKIVVAAQNKDVT